MKTKSIYIAAGLVLVWILLPGFPRFAQAQQNWNWVFGDSILMRFPGGGAPVVDTSAINQSFFEMSAAISDGAGNLLLFADDNAVFDRNSDSVPGSELVASSASITQGAIILPSPQTPFEFYVPFLGSLGDGASATLHSNTIAFDSTYLNPATTVSAYVLFDSFDVGLEEKMIAIRHANGRGWWLILHDGFNVVVSNPVRRFVTYLLQPDGFHGPYYQAIGSNHYGCGLGEVGQMAASQDGASIAVVGLNGLIEIFDFDRCTGQLSNPYTIYDGLPPCPPEFGDGRFYGCCFSQDGTKLYVAEGHNILNGCRLLQYDLTAPDIAASEFLVHRQALSATLLGQMQIGPDGKIYVGKYNAASPELAGFLGCINNPNVTGAACNFVVDAIDLKGRSIHGGLPNFPNYNLGPLAAMVADAGNDRAICAGDTLILGQPGTPPAGVLVLWSSKTVGEWIDSPASQQTAAVPTTSGWWYFTVMDTVLGGPCGTSLDSLYVTVIPAALFPVADAGPDTALCASSLPILLTLGNPDASGGIWSYSWANSSDTVTGGMALFTVTPAVTTEYFVTVTHPLAPAGCREARDTVTVTVETPVTAPVLEDVTACAGEPLQIGSSATPGLAYLWQPGSGLSDSLASDPLATVQVNQTYTLTVTDLSLKSSCRLATATQVVTVQPCGLPTVISGSQSLIFNGYNSPLTFTLYDMRGRLIYRSANYQGEVSADKLAMGLYWYRVEAQPGDRAGGERKLLVLH